MLELVGSIFAGLGLFFIGIRLIGSHLKQMTGRKVRTMLARLTQKDLWSALWGLLLGAIAQSTSAVTFILVSMLSAGMLTVRRAYPIINWANVGNSALVLIATVDLHLLVLYLLGVVGAAHFAGMDRSARWRHLWGALLGLGLLFFGLLEIKDGSAQLQNLDWFQAFLLETQDSYLLMFSAGLLLTLVAQSSTTVCVVAIAMAQTGWFGDAQTVILIYGSNVGSGISILLMSANLRGRPRQLALQQVAFKVAGALVLVPLFYVEQGLELPLLMGWLERMSENMALRMALVFLIYQLGAAVVMTLLTRPMGALLQRLSPSTSEEELAGFHFIYDQAAEEPELALELVEKEQNRVLRMLPQMVDTVREEGNVAYDAETLHRAGSQVLGEVQGFLQSLAELHPGGVPMVRYLALEGRNELLVSLDEVVFEMVQRLSVAREQSELGRVFGGFAESLHFLLSLAEDSLGEEASEDQALLLQMTGDRGNLMEQLRRTLLQESQGLSSEEQAQLYGVTTRFERLVWLLRRYVHSPSVGGR